MGSERVGRLRGGGEGEGGKRREKEEDRNKSQSVAREGGGRWKKVGRKEGDCDCNNAMASSVTLPNTH